MDIRKGTHVQYAGKGPLRGKEGITLEYCHPAQKRRVPVQLWGDQPFVAQVTPSKLSLIAEPDLLYPPISPKETSKFFVRAWDITLAWNIIRKGRRIDHLNRQQIERYYDGYLRANDEPPRFKIDPETGKERAFISLAMAAVDPEHARSEAVDLSIPTLWVVFEGDGILLIDGRHRAYKAYHTQAQSLPAIILTPAEENLIRLV